jgi:hypothetical protein
MEKIAVEIKLKMIWQTANRLEEQSQLKKAKEIREKYYSLYRKTKEIRYAVN